ncbi:hypothetical protein ACQ86N_24470 [Puia sp. P3]
MTELGKYRVEFFKSWIYTIARNHLPDAPQRPARP